METGWLVYGNRLVGFIETGWSMETSQADLQIQQSDWSMEICWYGLLKQAGLWKQEDSWPMEKVGRVV